MAHCSRYPACRICTQPVRLKKNVSPRLVVTHTNFCAARRPAQLLVLLRTSLDPRLTWVVWAVSISVAMPRFNSEAHVSKVMVPHHTLALVRSSVEISILLVGETVTTLW